MKTITVLLLLLYLSGCATTEEERVDGLSRMDTIKHDFTTFVADCYFTEGELVIDKRLEERRVQNAPITVWEMKNAQCFYSDESYPRRMP